MKIDTQLRDCGLDRVADEAHRLETIGFDGLWTFESAHDPFLPLLLAATATTRLTVGTNITVALARSPFVLAQTAWDLQKASGGRFHLGVGTQVRAHVERRFSMPFDHPAARITDYIRCVRSIWNSFQTGARAEHDGPFYRFSLITPFFSPGPIDWPDIPVYLAGVNARMCRAAGEVADGFHVHPIHSPAYLRDVVMPAIQDGARRAGRSLEGFALYAPVLAVHGESEAERARVEADVRRQIAFYGSTPNYRALFEYHGHGELARKLSQLMRAGELDAMPALIPDALLDTFAISGDLATLGRRLRERYAGILARVSLYFPVPPDDPDQRWQEFVSDFRG